jgi:pilus assembly protein Flp/PilA
MRQFLKNLASDETGATALEYGLIASLIAIVIVGTLRSIQVKITSVLNIISSAL